MGWVLGPGQRPGVCWERCWEGEWGGGGGGRREAWSGAELAEALF